MINYFVKLLSTLMLIEQHLSKIASCVKQNRRGYGDDASLSTKHWND